MYRYTLAALALLGSVTAQNTTVSLPLLAFDSQTILASIIASDSTATTFSLNCPEPTDFDSCGIPPSFTVTQGPSTLHYVITADLSSASIDGLTQSGSVDYACQLTGTTSAVCTVTDTDNFDGTSTSFVDSTTLTDASDLGYLPVTVTAGPTGNSEAKTTSSGSSKSSSASGSKTGVVTSNPGMPAVTAKAQWAIGGAAAAVLAYGAM